MPDPRIGITMRLKNEAEFYEQVEVSADTGEIETWDHVLFPNVIRKREVELILGEVEKVKPKSILDFGCGAGWLSKLLSSKGYNVVSIDASSSLIETASESSSELSRFIVGDCMNLPFRDNTFDFIVGISIFHHLDSSAALLECQRVATNNATLLLMEPNKLSPVAALGRKITNIQTKGERPFYPWDLRNTLIGEGWVTKSVKYLFPYSFGLAYLLKKLRGDKQGLKNICILIEASERFFEKIPYLNRLCWTMFVVATKGDRQPE